MLRLALVCTHPVRRKWQPTPVFLQRELYGQRSVASHSPWGHKLSDMIEQLTQHCKIYHCFIILNSNFSCVYVCLVTQSCPTHCDPRDCSPPGSSVRGDSPGNHTGVYCQALLQEFFPTQGSNSSLPHCRQILYHFSHQGSPQKVIFALFLFN